MTHSDQSSSENTQGKYPKSESTYNEALDELEIDLYGLLFSLWNQKWIVIGVTLFCLLTALGYILVSKPLYRISMQVRPINIASYEGWKVDDIKRWFEEGQYLSLLAKFPAIGKINAKISKGSEVVTLEMFFPQPNEGLKIFSDLYDKIYEHYAVQGRDVKLAHAKIDLENKLNKTKDEITNIESAQIPYWEELIENTVKELNLVKTRMKLLEREKELYSQASSELAQTMDHVKSNSQALLVAQGKLVSRKIDSLTKIILLNTIQQNIHYQDNLKLKLVDLDSESLNKDEAKINLEKSLIELQNKIEEIKTKIEELKLKKQDLLRQIDLYQFQIEQLRPFEKIAGPVASPRPVKPQKMIILAVAGVLGLFMGTLLAFLREGWQKRTSSMT